MEALRIHVPDEPLVLIPIGDIQYDGEGRRCDLRRLREVIEYGLSHPGGRFLGVGDYIDFTSPSNRRRLLSAALYDTATDAIDRMACAICDDLMEVLEPSRGRWLGLVHGHHYHALQSGKLSDEYLAERLDCPFLGTSAFLEITTPSARTPLRVMMHHYWAGGRTPGAHLHEAHRRVASHDADLYFYGHCHRLGVEPLVQLTTAEGEDGGVQILALSRGIIFCGSYALHWQQDSRFGGRPWGTYAEHKGLAPTVTGSPAVWCYPENAGAITRWRFRAFLSW